ncbi:MarR family winged helix-turn-helix transcriptional regulator [Lacisediminihabitans changchengi]|uniref:MarR family transcriptional regulator n=1 Tax=Lacisediminihabitans changchengi TaxID=2787634 RepID=A0A934SKQ2_9MICO|nr:MarR family transcriptional regulator [Lacisediminihabitans changchengi]MBK4347111.1 MarR family transcriptional regulator [Lacisediminihabitans changchengi]
MGNLFIGLPQLAVRYLEYQAKRRSSNSNIEISPLHWGFFAHISANIFELDRVEASIRPGQIATRLGDNLMETTAEARRYAGSTDGETPTHTLAGAFHHLEISLRRLRSEYATRLELTNSEYSALTAVGHAEQITPKELSRTLHMTTGAVTAMLDRLERAGLVVRQNHPKDRRSVLIVPTAQGSAALDAVVGGYQAAIDRLVATEDRFLDPMITELIKRAAWSLTQEAEALSDGSSATGQS